MHPASEGVPRVPLFVTDGGLETSLMFEYGIGLPHLAAFPLLADGAGREVLREYFRQFAIIARRHGVGLVVDTATWRASPDWGELLCIDQAALAELNRRAVALAQEIRTTAASDIPVVVHGVVGPRHDGAHGPDAMSAAEAERYHSFQIEAFAGTAVDLVSALTLAYAEEAIGIVNAARKAGLPVAVSFTLGADGRLPSGQKIGTAIARVDTETDGAAEYFMVNCASPARIGAALRQEGQWRHRVRGIRANANSGDDGVSAGAGGGSPTEFAVRSRRLGAALPELRILGGCCGTDARHIEALCAAVGVGHGGG